MAFQTTCPLYRCHSTAECGSSASFSTVTKNRNQALMLPFLPTPMVRWWFRYRRLSFGSCKLASKSKRRSNHISLKTSTQSGITTAITGWRWRALTLISRKSGHRHSGAWLGSSEPLRGGMYCTRSEGRLQKNGFCWHLIAGNEILLGLCFLFPSQPGVYRCLTRNLNCQRQNAKKMLSLNPRCGSR